MTKKLHHQNKPFTIRGHWWLPNVTHRVAGDLSYTEGDLTLSLYGGLDDAQVDSPFSATPKCTEYPVIHGESLDAVPLTLLHSFYTKWTPNIQTLAVRPGSSVAIRSSELHCGRLLEGLHLSSPDELFTKCRVEIPCLEEWLGDTPFNANIGEDHNTVQIDYARPKTQEFSVASANSTLRLIHTVRPPALPFGNCPAIEHRTYIELEPNDGISIDHFADQIAELVGMVAVLYGGPLLSERLTLYRNASSGHDEALLFYPRHKATAGKYQKFDFVVRFEQIKELFQTVVENWFGASETVKGVRRILLSSERRPSKFIELRFLPLVHAAEVFSNESTHAAILPKGEYKEVTRRMLEALPEGMPEELVESIKNSLGHANSRTLRRKLMGMLAELDDTTCKLFCIDKETFVKGIVDTRNHFTHYSTEEGRKILQGEDLHWAIQKSSLMLRLLLLVNAGVPESILQSAVQSHRRLTQERHVWQKMNEGGTVFSGMDSD